LGAVLVSSAKQSVAAAMTGIRSVFHIGVSPELKGVLGANPRTAVRGFGEPRMEVIVIEMSLGIKMRIKPWVITALSN